MESQKVALLDGLRVLSDLKKATELNKFPGHALFFNISIIDNNFLIRE